MNLLMSVVDRFFDALSDIEHPGSNCSLNLPIGNSGVITCKDGSLVSVIEIRGCRNYIGLTEHKKNVKELTDRLMPFYKSKAHDLGFYYESDNDPQVVEEHLAAIYSPVRSASRALGLLNESILREDMDVLKNVVHVENCWLVCWTNTKAKSVVPADERVTGEAIKQFRSNQYQDLNGITHHATRGSQHDAMVQGLLTVFKEQNFSVRQLSTAAMVRSIRKCIDARKTGANWEPVIVGNRQSGFVNPAEPKNAIKEGAAALMPLKLGVQVWPVEPTTLPGKPDVLKVGQRIYKVLAVRVQPNGPVPFNKLLKEASQLNIPLRYSGLLKSSGSTMLSFKSGIASMLTIIPFPGRNKTVRDELAKVEKQARETRTTNSAIQMCFATWALEGQERELDFNADKLLQIINSWNQAQAYFLKDDIQDGFCSTLPGYRNGSVAPAAVGPLEEILYCMPITRPVMPFDTGCMCFRSDDGRTMPFQPFDYNIMRHHVYLVVGEPGYGKSAMINNMLVSLVSASNDIPFIGIADVGTSSLGAILLAQSILPEGKKHLAKYYRLRNRVEDAVNFLEQDYGLRAPLKEHFDEICNQLELMMADDRSGALHPDLPGLIRAVVKLAYRIKADEGSKCDPDRFKANKQNDKCWPTIAAALQRINLKPTEDYSWWEIFDALHENGFYREAGMVMRFLSPTLPFLAQVATRGEIRDEYPGPCDSGMPIADFFARSVGEMVERYPIFSTYTHLDLGDARIVSLDLEEVVPRSSEGDYSLKKQGAIFFSTAARLLTSRFFWKEERLKDIPEKYHDYHEPRIRSIRQTTNALQIDELQRFSGIDQADSLCIKIANEGRKWEIGVILASQNVTEMPERLVQFSTARFLCGFEEKSISKAEEFFKLNRTEVELIVKRIRPPSKEGGWMLMQLDTDEGKYSHLLNIRKGPEKLWGLSTRNRDSVVRSRVYDAFGDVKGRALLGKMYPSGSIADEYDTRIQRLSEDTDMGLLDLDEITENTDVIATITQNIISKGNEIYTDELKRLINE